MFFFVVVLFKAPNHFHFSLELFLVEQNELKLDTIHKNPIRGTKRCKRELEQMMDFPKKEVHKKLAIFV